MLTATRRSSGDAAHSRPHLRLSLPSAGSKLGKAQAPVRVAVTGRTVGLPLFESMGVLGRERTLARLRAALSAL